MSLKKSSLRFDCEGLRLDWIGFTIQSPMESQSVKNFVDYLYSGLGASFLINETNDYKKGNRFYQSWSDPNLKFFVTPWVQPYWEGVIISFRGESASCFYRLIEEAKVNWDFFQEVKLNRIDLSYDRPISSKDRDYLSFLEASCQQYRKQSKRHKAEVKAWYFSKIGNRRSSTCGRHPSGSMRFEMEMKEKKKRLSMLRNFLVSHSIENFETSLIEYFYQSWTRWLEWKNPWSDWLVDRIRRIRTERDHFNSLLTTYLKSSWNLSQKEEEEIYTLFQLLSFLRTLTGQKEKLINVYYYRIEFPLTDFLEYIGRKGRYQQRQIFEILRSLSFVNQPIIEVFEDSSFRSYLPIPVVVCDNSHKTSILKLSIEEKLYLYRYSFRFPIQFLKESGKIDRKIKLCLIQVMSQTSLRKEFQISSLLNGFSGSNQKKKQIIWFISVLCIGGRKVCRV